MSLVRFASTALILTATMTSLLSLTGCGAVKDPILLKTPDTPMVLLDSVEARVGVEDPPGSGEIVEYGRVLLERGQTVVWYDWDR